jgi:hypothetical protein
MAIRPEETPMQTIRSSAEGTAAAAIGPAEWFTGEI